MSDSFRLAEAEYEWLNLLMNRFAAQRAMNLEALDGFFAALICAPRCVAPEKYLPELWGGEKPAEEIFNNAQEAQKFKQLIQGHWKHVAHALETSVVLLPLFIEDEKGKICGNDWAIGFLRGMELSGTGWGELLKNDEEAGLLAPIFALAYEHHPDLAMRSYEKPVSKKQRDRLIAQLIVNVPGIYEYFASQRLENAPNLSKASNFYQISSKTTMPVLCVCGSGKKYEDCCAKRTVH